MSYPQGYPQGQYAGYGQPPQTHMYQANQAQYQQQHPVVVIPRQPRHETASFQTSPHLQQPGYQANFYQQAPQQTVPYQQPNQQQYLASQRQKYNSHVGVSQQYATQDFYTAPSTQPVYQPTPNYPPQQSSPQLQYQQQTSPQLQYQSQLSPQLQYQQQPSPQVRYQQQWPSPLLQNRQQRPSPQLQNHQQRPSPQVQGHRQPKSQDSTAPSQHQPQPAQSYSHSPALAQPSQPYVHPQVLVNPSRPRPDVQAPQRQSSQQRPSQILSSPDPLQQAPTPHRVVARVEIPVQRSSSMAKSQMAPAPKRRRSNEGHAIPMCEVPPQRKQPVPARHAQVPPSSSPLTELNSSQMPPTPTPMLKNEYQSMLLALSDEYVNAAYSMSSQLDSDDQRAEYHRLMSMGIACLESLLNNYRQSDARREARIRLRLASLLADETDSSEEVVDLLGTGVALCNANRFVDLKYAMRHTLACFTARKKPKEALNEIDKVIEEVELLRLGHWMYAFRFLRVSLSLQSEIYAEMTAALKHINVIKTIADDERNIAVQIVAASIEAVIHLRIGSSEAGDLAQRAMAAARMHQLGPEMQSLPQMRGLLDCLDLMCALVQLDRNQAAEKMQQMHTNLDQGTRDAGWTRDGNFTVELCPVDNEELDQDVRGIMKINNGQACLSMKWVTAGQLYALGYLLSGMTSLLRDDKKVENYFGEGIKMTTTAPSPMRQSLTSSDAITERSEHLNIVMRMYVVFARCGQGDWHSGRTAIQELRKDIASVGADVDESTQRMLLHLEGMFRQGLGELKAALQLYESPLLAPQLDTKVSVAEKDLRTLATMNRIFILQSLGPHEIQLAGELSAAIEPYCRNHTNESLVAAYLMLKAAAQGPHASIIKTKQYQHTAINASKRAQNKQLIYMLMNLMTASFFHDTIIGDQAEKAAHAGRQLAKQSRSALWTVVADNMYSDIMERCGKLAEADGAREEAMSFYTTLPGSLKEKLSRG